MFYNEQTALVLLYNPTQVSMFMSTKDKLLAEWYTIFCALLKGSSTDIFCACKLSNAEWIVGKIFLFVVWSDIFMMRIIALICADHCYDISSCCWSCFRYTLIVQIIAEIFPHLVDQSSDIPTLCWSLLRYFLMLLIIAEIFPHVVDHCWDITLLCGIIAEMFPYCRDPCWDILSLGGPLPRCWNSHVVIIVLWSVACGRVSDHFVCFT